MGRVPSPQQLAEDIATSESARNEVMATFNEIIHDEIPVAENMDFVFLLENIPISLREQMVRHRVGHKFGENFGVDIFPGEVSSSWWSQTTRIVDMGTFAAEERYFTPDCIGDQEVWDPFSVTNENPEGSTCKAIELYERFMLCSQEVYSALTAAGLDREDARQVIPMAATSRISWKLNYASLKHIVARRTCWMIQLGMWEGIIHDMLNELANQIHPAFRQLAQPPCFRRDAFVGCPFVADNLGRIRGEEPGLPCPLFLNMHRDDVNSFVPVDDRVVHPSGNVRWDFEEAEKREKYAKRQEAYAMLWDRDVWTGEKVQR